MRTNTINLRSRINQLDQVDWDFALARSRSAFSSLHWYPCRYPSQIPATLIGALSSPGEMVLDPFLGSGTTAVEAQRLGRACIGVELNPVAALMSKAKTLSHDAKSVARMVDKILVAVHQTTRRLAVPQDVQIEKWYTPRTIEALRRIKFAISGLKGDTQVIGEAAFSAILIGVCRETRHWGYVCDNTAPKEDYERNVVDEFDKVLEGFREAYAERDEYLKLGEQSPRQIQRVEVLEGDSTDILETLPEKSAHLIVTSPPYFGVADYVKAQRLTLEWQQTDIEKLRQKEIGARSKRRRHTAAEEYLADCSRIFEKCRKVLVDGRACAVVFGESANREPMYRKFQAAVENCGFSLQHRAVRKISSGRRFNPSLQREHLLIFT